MEQKKEPGNILSRNKGKVALVAALAGGIAVGPDALQTALRTVHDVIITDSKIVAGAPAQVESHTTGKHCASYVKGACTSYRTDYYLEVEQCPDDMRASLERQQLPPFNPKLGAIYEDCYTDYVEVSSDTYPQSLNGSTIVFAGAVGEPLKN